MDLGIGGKWAILAGSSQGLGFACAQSLAREGVNVVVNGRNREMCEEAANLLAATFGVTTRAVVADVTTPKGRTSLVEACPSPDLLVTNCGGPSPTDFVTTSHEAFQAAFEQNFHSAVGLIQLVLPSMKAQHFGRIVNITSAMVKSPHPFMTLSIAARTALTGVTKAVSKEVAPFNVTINNLLPERIDTGRQRQMAELQVQLRGITLDEAYEEMAASIAAKRLGRPEEVGDACAFLCAAQSGFISGQNLHLDGGSYEGLL